MFGLALQIALSSLVLRALGVPAPQATSGVLSAPSSVTTSTLVSSTTVSSASSTPVSSSSSTSVSSVSSTTNSSASSAPVTSSSAGSSTLLPSQPTAGPTTVPASTPAIPTSSADYQPPAAPNATTRPELSPYTPVGGLDIDQVAPLYRPISDFDFQSLTLALYQEYIELDLFHHGLAQFSDSEFEAAGLSAQDRFLIEYMADQEVGHAEVISNIIGQGVAAQQCNYSYPFGNVRDFIDFSQKLTAFGESGVHGFLEHLNSRASASLLLDSIAIESRQQMILRQFEGLFPMPTYTVPGISQSMAWTLLAPYIVSCPENNTRLIWQNFPGLNITNNPNVTTLNVSGNSPAISGHNLSQPLSAPGYVLQFQWENPGLPVGPNGSYTTNTTAGTPAYVAWISQLNTTYTTLNVTGNNTGTTVQPLDYALNGTMFVALTDANPYITPHNVSQLNQHIVAGPAVYQSS